MGRFAGSAFLIVIGAGLLAVAWRGQRDGELPAGSNFLRPFRPSRRDNAVAFHFFLAIYFCGGTILLVWGLLALLGMAPALPLR